MLNATTVEQYQLLIRWIHVPMWVLTISFVGFVRLYLHAGRAWLAWSIYALRTVCTHLGCITLWSAAERKFKCPCHGSGFRADGMNFEGPASRPLERYAIRVADDGQLEIDRSRVFHEELGQWNDPDSYVVV